MFRTLLAAAMLSAPALAQATPDWDEGHTQVLLGFAGGQRSWSDAPFALTSNDEGVAGMSDTFSAVPYDRTAAFGLRTELRAVFGGMRVSTGYTFPFPTYDGLDTLRADTMVDGKVQVRSTGVSVREWRVGLGFEPPSDTVVPFVDVVGDTHRIRTTVAINGDETEYTSRGFSLLARGGARIYTSDHAFVELAGEYGLTGANGWGAQVMYGLAFY